MVREAQRQVDVVPAALRQLARVSPVALVVARPVRAERLASEARPSAAAGVAAAAGSQVTAALLAAAGRPWAAPAVAAAVASRVAVKQFVAVLPAAWPCAAAAVLRADHAVRFGRVARP